MAAALRDSRSPGIAPDPGAAGPSKELLPWPLFPMDMRIEELNGPPEKALFADPRVMQAPGLGLVPRTAALSVGHFQQLRSLFAQRIGRVNSRAICVKCQRKGKNLRDAVRSYDDDVDEREGGGCGGVAVDSSSHTLETRPCMHAKRSHPRSHSRFCRTRWKLLSLSDMCVFLLFVARAEVRASTAAPVTASRRCPSHPSGHRGPRSRGRKPPHTTPPPQDTPRIAHGRIRGLAH